MNKKFLSAVLFGALMAGSSVTFTGCIDNDEPAGIEELRGAKAELLKAKAAVELANEAMVRAQVANQELLNKAQELANKNAEIENQMKELDRQIKEAETAAEVAKLELEKQKWENEKALAAEQFKAEMLRAQAATAQAQLDYENALKAIELAKLTLSDKEKDVLRNAQCQVENAQRNLKYAYQELLSAQDRLDGAYENTTPQETKEWLELEVAEKALAVEIAKQHVAEIEELIAKNISTFEGWEAEVKNLEKKIAEQDTILAQAAIDRIKIEESEAGKKAAEAVRKAEEAVTKAEKNKNDAYAGQKVGEKSYTFKLDKWSHEVTSNKALVEVLNDTNVGDVATEAYGNGKFSYAEVTYNQNQYKENKGTDAEKALKEMIALVDAVPGRAAEDLAWVKRELSAKEKTLEDAEKAYNIAIEDWKKAVEDFKNGKDYTQAQYKIARDKVLGVLTEVQNGRYQGTSDVSKEAQKMAYESYTTLYAEMKNNGQNIPDQPSSVKDYETLYSYLQNNEVTSLLPSAYTVVTEATRKAALMAKSQAAFGNLYMFEDNGGENPRLTAPTAKEIANEQAKIAKGEATYGDYAAIGAVWSAEDDVTYYTQIIEQADAIKELKETLVAQQEAVTEKVAANTAAVKAFDTALDAAKADLKAKKDAEKALCAKVKETEDKANALRASYNAIKTEIERQMSQIANGATSVNEIKNALAAQLIDAQKEVARCEADLKDAQTVLADFEAGKYDKQYEIDYLVADLAHKQARYDEALVIYNETVANLNKVLEALSKQPTIPAE